MPQNKNIADIQRINLNVLIKEYRNKQNLYRAYLDIKKFPNERINPFSDSWLSNQVAFEISGYLIFRDRINSLMNFYCMLQVGIVSNHISPALTKRLRNEIKTAIGNKSLNNFYSEIHPKPLLNDLYTHIVNWEPPSKKNDNKSNLQDNEIDINSQLFAEFITIVNQIENDYDIKAFFTVLENKFAFIYSIDNFLDIFKNQSKLNKILTSEDSKGISEFAFWGFIKLVTLLSDFRKLLDKASMNPKLQSTFWDFESFLFTKLKNPFFDVFNLGIISISEQVDSTKLFQELELDSQRDRISFQNESNEVLKKIKIDMGMLFGDTYRR